VYRNHKIGLAIPAYNEERLIGPTLDSIPDIVDVVYVVNDCSLDDTAKVVCERAEKDPRIVLVEHEENQGTGGGIITGYLRASEAGCDICVVT
ncbi:uncharacterized protein METZ01_LOCUS428626, partial [marine metagenome]